MTVRVKCALRYPVAENIFSWFTEQVRIVLDIPSYIKIFYIKWAKCAQIALAIQFLSIVDQEVGHYLEV